MNGKFVYWTWAWIIIEFIEKRSEIDRKTFVCMVKQSIVYRSGPNVRYHRLSRTMIDRFIKLNLDFYT